jgi:hypothetical protein
MKGRERLTVARVSGYLRRGSGQTSTPAMLLTGSGRRRCHDDDLLVEWNSVVMTKGSIVSRRRR